MALRSVLLGFVLAAAVLAGFHLYGPQFFIDGRSPFQTNFAAGAGIGLLLGLVGPFVCTARGSERPMSAILIALPGLIAMAAVTSHFAIVFKALDPVMDKVFGALMLWSYAFLLVGGLLKWRR
ncbi:DUF5367 family protein [Alsobacter sp. R-9]